jgi:hypothetical protein
VTVRAIPGNVGLRVAATVRNLGLVVFFASVGPLTATPMAHARNVDPHQPKILLHVVQAPRQNPCAELADSSLSCSGVKTLGDVQTSPGAGPFYLVYLLVARGDSMPDVAAVQCGLVYESSLGFPADGASDHQGLDILGWTLCATMQFTTPTPTWPNPYSGNLITWDWTNACQTGELANAGYFYCAAYSPDFLSIIPRLVDFKALVADCRAVVSNPIPPSGLGFVGFGTYGCNPCLDPVCYEYPRIPIVETTWGAIKSIYR